MTTAFVTHRACFDHYMGAHHPECPDRLAVITDRLIAFGIDPLLVHYEAPLAQRAHLLRAHDASYVETLEARAPKQGIVHVDPDTAMSPGTWQAALHAAGAGVLATDLVMKAEVANAFCAVRPPGHHAERARAMGFCFFNNVAIAALHAIEAWGLSRVAIVDFDVHHGNGTEDIFAGNDKVLMVGSFQHPFYPYCGTGDTAPNMCNVPLPAGSDGDDFRRIASDIWLPRLSAFAPEIIFISAGFDAHCEDDMASLALTESDYIWITRQVKAIAEQTAQGRIVSMLEGGYALAALARSVTAHIKVLADI